MANYFVVDEHTLVYEDVGGGLFILKASILRGSPYAGDGSIPRPMSKGALRIATLDDFKEYRVMAPPQLRAGI